MQHQADNLALWLQKGLGRGNKRTDVRNSSQITQRDCNVVKETDSDDLNTASQASRNPQATFIDEKFKVRLIARRISRQWEMRHLGESHRHSSVCEDTKLKANWNGEHRWRMPNQRSTLVIKIKRDIFTSLHAVHSCHWSAGHAIHNDYRTAISTSSLLWKADRSGHAV